MEGSSFGIKFGEGLWAVASTFLHLHKASADYCLALNTGGGIVSTASFNRNSSIIAYAVSGGYSHGLSESVAVKLRIRTA